MSQDLNVLAMRLETTVRTGCPVQNAHYSDRLLARRMATHNRFFATLADVLTAVSTCFDCWRKPNSVLRRLCGMNEAPRSKLRGITEHSFKDFSETEPNPVASYGEYSSLRRYL